MCSVVNGLWYPLVPLNAYGCQLHVFSSKQQHTHTVVCDSNTSADLEMHLAKELLNQRKNKSELLQNK